MDQRASYAVGHSASAPPQGPAAIRSSRPSAAPAACHGRRCQAVPACAARRDILTVVHSARAPKHSHPPPRQHITLRSRRRPLRVGPAAGPGRDSLIPTIGSPSRALRDGPSHHPQPAVIFLQLYTAHARRIIHTRLRAPAAGPRRRRNAADAALPRRRACAWAKSARPAEARQGSAARREPSGAAAAAATPAAAAAGWPEIGGWRPARAGAAATDAAAALRARGGCGPDVGQPTRRGRGRCNAELRLGRRHGLRGRQVPGRRARRQGALLSEPGQEMRRRRRRRRRRRPSAGRREWRPEGAAAAGSGGRRKRGPWAQGLLRGGGQGGGEGGEEGELRVGEEAALPRGEARGGGQGGGCRNIRLHPQAKGRRPCREGREAGFLCVRACMRACVPARARARV